MRRGGRPCCGMSLIDDGQSDAMTGHQLQKACMNPQPHSRTWVSLQSRLQAL